MTITDHQIALQPIVHIFKAEDLWAYGTFDDENRWCVACDLETGHIDIRIGEDGYALDVWAILTGMFVDEENYRRRMALERLARVSIPGLQRGFLDELHTLSWDDSEKGLALRKSVQVPFSATPLLPTIAIDQLNDLNRTLLYIERQLHG